MWTQLRAAGRFPGGRPPLVFGDLYRDASAHATLAALVGGFAVALVGVLSATPVAFAAGALVVGAGGAVAVWNLATGPARAVRARIASAGAATGATA